jgi:ribosomal protein S18 acetylase RimI-like enzyme
VDGYRLEPARIADAGVLALMSRSLVEAGLQHSWDTQRILWHVRHAESVVLTARHDRAIAGFAIMRYADSSAHLNLLAVQPAHRRRGVARALLGWLEETALTAGTFVIALELRAGNEAARAFYHAHGYQDVGEIRGYYQGVESALRMRRDLRSGVAPLPPTREQTP